MTRVRIRAWWLRVTGRRWDHDLLRDADRRRAAEKRAEEMSYVSYVLPDGRQAGYGVEATCEAPDCTEEIDRGLAYLCGDNPMGDEHGCTHHFCSDHLFVGGPSQLCEPCFEKWAAAHLAEVQG